jgi:SpoIID/LytB domain protein
MRSINVEPTIRVGILAATTITFELKGDFLLNSEIVQSGSYSVSVEEKGKFPSEYVPKSLGSTFILKDVTIGIGFHWEKDEDQEFKGGLTLQVEGDKIRAINTVPIESYLESVISSEMSAMNDPNLLNAHAIVSRSWLLAQILHKAKLSMTSDCFASANASSRNDGTGHVDSPSVASSRNDGTGHVDSPSVASATNDGTVKEIVKWYDREDHNTFDVCADDHCQRYQGITKVISSNAQKAIVATRGQVLMFDDEICDARFSKCCGGITEDFENVWQPVKVPYLVAVRDVEPKMFPRKVHFENESFITTLPEAFCNTSDPGILEQVLIDFDRTTTNFYRWSVEYSQHELSALLLKKSGFDFGDIVDLIPIERGNSGRIIRLQIVGTKCKITVGKELEIRKWLSESHLYSSAFVVEKIIEDDNQLPDRFIIRGAGWGHGVGMCQIGAAVMSREGKTPTQILEHYYKGARIERIYL